MARRSSLPGADELFRTTSTPTPPAPGALAPSSPAPATVEHPGASRPNDADTERSADQLGHPTSARELSTVGIGSDRARSGSGRSSPASAAQRSGRGVRRVSRAKPTDAEHQPSGRERHEEKITVYVSPQELLELERARWVLRAEHGLASDRGRIVREAVAVVLADLEAKGAHSILVTRLQELENR